jgi:hypothetical protein
MSTSPTAPANWLHHLEEEADAAYLYRELAGTERDQSRADLYRQLAAVEDRHVEMWRKLLAEHGHSAPHPTPSRGARLRAWIARRFGPQLLLPLLLEEEGREVKGYLSLYRESPSGVAGPTALTLARESKEHADRLASISGRSGEPWHKTGAGGFLRNVVYGFNDGLTANFGLVAGMVGAQATLGEAGHSVLVAGLAGMVADALSMGSSGYLAAKSEREVFDHEIAMEQEEIRLMPELEREELSLIYQAKGIPAGQAQAIATQVMEDPVRALEEKVREDWRGDHHPASGSLDNRHRHGSGCIHPGGSVSHQPRDYGDLGRICDCHAFPLRRGGCPELLYRSRSVPERDRYVHRRAGSGRGWVCGGGVDS